MNLNDLIKKWEESSLTLVEAELLINKLIAERGELSEETPLWKQVLGQTDFYFGHGQLTLAEITLEEATNLCEDLSNNTKGLSNLFYIKLFKEKAGYSGSVHQYTCLGKEDKLWVSFDEITL